MSKSFRALLALVASLAPAPSVSADIVILKDGFVIQGKVRQETKTVVDEVTREPFHMPKGFMLLDDGPRRIYFSPSQAREAVKKAPPEDEKIPADRQFIFANNVAIPYILEVLDTPPFDEGWNRIIKFRGPSGQMSTRQHVGMITPYYTRIDGMPRYNWAAYHLTREFSPETIQQLLATHSKFKPAKDLKPAEALARRFRYCDFFAQAGWFEEAEAELGRMQRDFPEQKETLDNALASVGKLKARERFEDIKRLHAAGLLETARKRAGEFPETHASEEIIAAYRDLKSEQNITSERMARLVKHFDDLTKLLSGPVTAPFAAMAAAMKAEMHPDGVARLEAFLGQANQAERQRQAGRTANLSAAELLSLAWTGWLLGNAAAEAKPDVALRLWSARKFVLDYQRCADPERRGRMLAAFQKERSGAASLDEITQIIPHLPPPEPEENLKERTLELTVESAARRGSKFLLRLPPEYNHGRSWPLLIVLHNSGENAQRMLDRWADAAGENGYLLAAPIWQNALAGGYSYTEAEHGIVLDMLRDLRRRFNVDSDRVFLFGLGQGGSMAYDVGLSHPDVFAGVIPMAAGPEYFAERYFRNGLYLPFYVVNGDRSGPGNRKIREQFEFWAVRGYPSVWIQYKGRGAEWFGGEIPNIFDWMRAKRRAFPLQQLGTDGNGTPHGNEFTMMRAGDSRFYWLSAESINDRCCTTAERWANVTPAHMTARIDPGSNEIFVRQLGVKQLRIWLGRNSKGQSMIDFDKPLTIRVNLAPRWINRKVTPSLEVLMEDFYARGDRQQLYLAKVDLGL